MPTVLLFDNHTIDSVIEFSHEVKCNRFHHFLALIHSNRWLLWCGNVSSLFLMLFFYLGLTKVEELLMTSIEKITSQNVKKEIKSFRFIQSDGEKKLWSTVVADLTLRALGSNSFEILYPLIQSAFSIPDQSDESLDTAILIVIFFPFL